MLQSLAISGNLFTYTYVHSTQIYMIKYNSANVYEWNFGKGLF